MEVVRGVEVELLEGVDGEVVEGSVEKVIEEVRKGESSTTKWYPPTWRG